MRAGRTSGNGAHRVVARRPSPDTAAEAAGFSYVEVLVAIVLVGVAVIATLVGLRTTVVSGRVGAERSQLMLWVNEGVEALHRGPYVACSDADLDGYMTTSEADAIRTAYQAQLNAVAAPEGMSGGTLVVDVPRLMSIDPFSLTEHWDDRQCDPDFEVVAMRVTATSPTGTSVDVEVIVDG